MSAHREAVTVAPRAIAFPAALVPICDASRGRVATNRSSARAPANPISATAIEIHRARSSRHVAVLARSLAWVCSTVRARSHDAPGLSSAAGPHGCWCDRRRAEGHPRARSIAQRPPERPGAFAAPAVRPLSLQRAAPGPAQGRAALAERRARRCSRRQSPAEAARGWPAPLSPRTCRRSGCESNGRTIALERR
jgi:hypothetical protein